MHAYLRLTEGSPGYREPVGVFQDKLQAIVNKTTTTTTTTNIPYHTVTYQNRNSQPVIPFPNFGHNWTGNKKSTGK